MSEVMVIEEAVETRGADTSRSSSLFSASLLAQSHHKQAPFYTPF
jgi:hypothetical protein